MSFPAITDLLNAAFGTNWALPIPTFGVFVALAMVIATRVARAEVRRCEVLGRVPRGTSLMVGDLVFTAALAGLAGARLFHILDNPGQFLADPLAMIFTRAGFSIHGGLIAGIGTGVLMMKRRGLPVVPMLDAIAPSLMLAYAIGRLGCQLAGDGDWGVAANMALKPEWLPDWMWAQTYDGNVIGAFIAAPGVYPTPLYESAASLLLFAVLWRLRLRNAGSGYLFSLYVVLAGFERLLIEKIRINPEHQWLGVSATQAEFISMLLVVAGLTGMIAASTARRWWPRCLLAVGILAALSACARL